MLLRTSIILSFAIAVSACSSSRRGGGPSQQGDGAIAARDADTAVDSTFIGRADSTTNPPDATVEPACTVQDSGRLSPSDVGSTSTSVFTTLPSDDPVLFGFTGADVRVINFDVDPEGVPIAHDSELTDEYAEVGVTMNSIRVRNDVWMGPASEPNATWENEPQVYNFTVPVAALGIINTSPDGDGMEFWSGPDATGRLLHELVPSTADSVDEFIFLRTCKDAGARSVRITNASGDLELDELIFEVAQEFAPR